MKSYEVEAFIMESSIIDKVQMFWFVVTKSIYAAAPLHSMGTVSLDN